MKKNQEENLLKLRESLINRKLFGGPGSGPQGGGGSGDDDSGGETAATVAKIPRDKRSEKQIKTLYKNKPKAELKDIVTSHKEWQKKNTDKVGTVEHRTVSRELNVADRILREKK